MARGKSSESTQSTNPPSTQASPKKKPISLSTSTSTKSVPVPAPPPGIAPPPGLAPVPVPVEKEKAPAPVAAAPPVAAPAPEVEDTMPEESISADSEAGPSSASPAPQTPSVAADNALPAPLRSDPIIVHSPYDEPEIYTFPASDPDFEFVLGLDSNETYDYQAPNSPFTPTPFSKTLVGLAELGIWSPTLPVVESPRQPTFRSSFQPFDMNNDTPTAVAGPSRTRPETPPPVEEEEEQPRTTSRFDFARQAINQTPQSPYSTSRGQSPFTLRRSHLEQNDWAPPTPLAMLNGGRQMQQQHQAFEEQLVQRQQPQHTGDSRASAFAQQISSFVGSYGSSNDWGQGQDHVGSPGVRIDGRMSGLSMGNREYDSGGTSVFTPIYEVTDNQQSTDLKVKVKDKDHHDYSHQIHQSMKNNINTQIQINNIIFNNHSTNNSSNSSNKVDIHLL
jgi:hypothetical protein